MTGNRTIKFIFTIGLVLLLVLGCLMYLGWERVALRPLDFLSEQQLSAMKPEQLVSLEMIQLYGQQAPADIDNNTVFVPIPSGELSNEEIVAVLSSAVSCIDPSCRLYLQQELLEENIGQLVSRSIPLSLIVARGQQYQQLSLMLSTMPIMDMKTLRSYVDNQNTTIYAGNYCLFSAGDVESSEMTTSGMLEWHVRGSTSAFHTKKPWKLNLKNAKGKSMKMQFLDLGTDDDWIMNNMCFDDVKVREKFALDFWNTYIQNKDNLPMSQGRYTELFVDGEYRGVYLLERRIDEEYLPINSEREIIFKGITNDRERGVYGSYEVIYSPFSSSQAYQLLDDARKLRNGHDINFSSYIDTSLFLNYIAAVDNIRHKNNFYILQEDEGYSLSFVPWDTDYSFGTTWVVDRPAIGDTLDKICLRHEHEDFSSLFPQLEYQTAQRWMELRQDVYTEENIVSMLDKQYALVQNSGALIRDKQKWGEWNQGADTYDKIVDFAIERLDVLDEYYSAILEAE